MRRRFARLLPACWAVATVVAGSMWVSPAPGRDAASKRRNAAPLPVAPRALAGCPWLVEAMAAHEPANALASLVVSKMSLAEKLGEIVLHRSGLYENVNSGVPRLCIPALTLQDGPAGLAFGDTGVTQLPAPLALAASFDPALAYRYGQLLGQEAAGQGIDVLQAPDLNIDRIPQSGRSYEGMGEDPLLVSRLGDAEISGIQSAGVMAQAKHFAVYSQETNRGALDTLVSDRALNEIYLPPFVAAVTRARVASIMCAYPRLNGVFQCQDPALEKTLQGWGFAGFVRSDEGAVHDAAAALKAGTDLLKPASTWALAADVADGSLPLSVVDAAVERVLSTMFSYHLIGHAVRGVPSTPVDTAGHQATALRIAERSVVLLRNTRALLPLKVSRLHSVAVIGAAASESPVTAGYGSSHVIPPFVSTPLQAIKARLGPGVDVDYQAGGSTTRPLPLIPSADLSPSSGSGHGLDLTVGHAGKAGRLVSVIDPVASASVRVEAPVHPAPNPVKSNPPAVRNPRMVTMTGGAQINLPSTWGPAAVTWSGTLRVPRNGLYSFSLHGSGAARLTLDGRTAVNDSVMHGSGTWSGAVQLTAGRHRLALSWTPLDNSDGTHSTLTVGMADDTYAVAAAVSAARSAQVAVVVAGDYSGETFDRPSLDLPGDQNALIEAVAAANRRTIVVLDTGGATLMPWLGRVASVLEAWYPGEQDGAAIAAVLAGDFDPAGRLPITFPTSARTTGVSTAAQWPGVGLVSSYSEGLDVGYRYDHQTGTRPLFPFGFGLSYTRFALSDLHLKVRSDVVKLSLKVHNIGRRVGTEVVQAYLSYPRAAQEPPGQLAAFDSVTIAPGHATKVTLLIPRAKLETYRQRRGWSVMPGRYRIGVGESSGSQPLRASFSYA